MKYKVISRANGMLAHALRAEGADFSIANYVEEAGSGHIFDSSMFQVVRSRLAEIIAEHPEGKSPGMEFDAIASIAVHKSLQLPPEIAGDSGFWRWLAIAEFPDVVDWRHPGKEGISKPGELWYRNDLEQFASTSMVPCGNRVLEKCCRPLRTG